MSLHKAIDSRIVNRAKSRKGDRRWSRKYGDGIIRKYRGYTIFAGEALWSERPGFVIRFVVGGEP